MVGQRQLVLFFSFLPSHFHLGFKKPQFDIEFRTKFVKKNTLPQTRMEFPLIKHKGLCDLQGRSLFLIHQLTSRQPVFIHIKMCC